MANSKKPLLAHRCKCGIVLIDEPRKNWNGKPYVPYYCSNCAFEGCEDFIIMEVPNGKTKN